MLFLFLSEMFPTVASGLVDIIMDRRRKLLAFQGTVKKCRAYHTLIFLGNMVLKPAFGALESTFLIFFFAVVLKRPNAATV